MKRLLTGTEVKVRIEDVECPEPDVILANLTSETELVGKVKFLSDGMRCRDEFAIVEASGLRVPLVVRVEKLKMAGPAANEMTRELGEIAREVK